MYLINYFSESTTRVIYSQTFKAIIIYITRVISFQTLKAIIILKKKWTWILMKKLIIFAFCCDNFHWYRQKKVMHQTPCWNSISHAFLLSLWAHSLTLTLRMPRQSDSGRGLKKDVLYLLDWPWFSPWEVTPRRQPGWHAEIRNLDLTVRPEQDIASLIKHI